jgi:hypothetical protein
MFTKVFVSAAIVSKPAGVVTNSVLAQSSNSGSASGFLVVIAFILFAVYWTKLQNDGVRPRSFTTNATVDQLVTAFDQKVAGHGWKVIDSGNPRIAQSSLVTGIRQQIGLFYTRTDSGVLTVAIAPIRVAKKGLLLRRPTKSHTLRIRMNSFEAALREADPTLQKSDNEAARTALVKIQNSTVG